MNAITVPITVGPTPTPPPRDLPSSSSPAAVSAGIARKNDSRVASTRSMPRSSPALMVAPDRDTPGTSAAHGQRGLAPVLRRPPLGVPHDGAPGDQSDRDHRHAAQRPLDHRLERQAQDADRDRPDDDAPGKPPVRVGATLGRDHPAGEAPHQPDDVGAEVKERSEDRPDLDDRGEGRDRLVVHLEAEQLLGHGQVSGAGHRQELGEPLDDAEYDGLDRVHAGESPASAGQRSNWRRACRASTAPANTSRYAAYAA